MSTMLNEKRTIRAHGLRTGDQMTHRGMWWVVERQLHPGQTIVIRGKNGEADKSVNVPKEGTSVLAQRGSRRTVFTLNANEMVKIIRQREKVGS